MKFESFLFISLGLLRFCFEEETIYQISSKKNSGLWFYCDALFVFRIIKSVPVQISLLHLRRKLTETLLFSDLLTLLQHYQMHSDKINTHTLKRIHLWSWWDLIYEICTSDMNIAVCCISNGNKNHTIKHTKHSHTLVLPSSSFDWRGATV